jgi:serine/threonine protein kinase
MSKKFNETISMHKEKSIDETGVMQKHYFYNGNANKDSKVTIKGREKSGLMDFTAQLNTQESEALMQPKSGLSLDQFELGRKLGKGRFGDVFMAREIKTGFALAIKIINKK